MGTVTVFRTPEEAALELELPLLGVVPVPPDARGPFEPSVPADEDVAQSYRRAVERVLRPGEPRGSIGVVGDVDAAHRAYVSGALAAALAAERGTVLVDADLRAAHLSFDAGARAQEGLVDVLRYGVRSPRVVAPTSTAGLDLLPVGSATVDLIGTYGSDAAAPLFEELRRGGFLVVNGPGPGEVEAAAPLLRRVSGWVLLVETGRSDAEVSRRIRDAMGAARCAGVLVAAPRPAASVATPAAAPADAPPRAAVPPAPARVRPAAAADLPPAPPAPRPLPPVVVRPVKNVTPARGVAAPESTDRPPPIAADPRRTRRIAWWIGAAALVSVAIALMLLRPEGEPATEPAAPLTERPAGVARVAVPEVPEAGSPETEVAAITPPAETPADAATGDAGAPELAIGIPEDLRVGLALPGAAPATGPAETGEPATAEPATEEPATAEPATAEPVIDLSARTVPLVAGQEVWAVHVSSFQTQAAADGEAARFAAAGLPTVLHAVDVPGKGRWVRIYVGPFADRATAEEAAGRVRAGIQEYTMVRRLPAGELQDGTGRGGR